MKLLFFVPFVAAGLEEKSGIEKVGDVEGIMKDQLYWCGSESGCKKYIFKKNFKF